MTSIKASAKAIPGLLPLNTEELGCFVALQGSSQKVSKFAIIAFFQNIIHSIKANYSTNDVEKLGGGTQNIRARNLVRCYENLTTKYADELKDKDSVATKLQGKLKNRLINLRDDLILKRHTQNLTSFETEILAEVDKALEVHTVNFRQQGYMENLFRSASGEQVQKDQGRYNGSVTYENIRESVSKAPTEEIRKNILFSCSQNFELALTHWLQKQFGSDVSVGEAASKNDPIEQEKERSTLQCNPTTRKTVLQCKLKAKRYDGIDKENPFTFLEKFKITAIMNWDTAEVTIFKQKLKPSPEDIRSARKAKHRLPT